MRKEAGERGKRIRKNMRKEIERKKENEGERFFLLPQFGKGNRKARAVTRKGNTRKKVRK